MPVFNYKCECGNSFKEIRFKSKIVSDKIAVCKRCGKFATREFGGPTVQKKERIDDGHSPKVVERLQNAQELFKERADKDK